MCWSVTKKYHKFQGCKIKKQENLRWLWIFLQYLEIPLCHIRNVMKGFFKNSIFVVLFVKHLSMSSFHSVSDFQNKDKSWPLVNVWGKLQLLCFISLWACVGIYIKIVPICILWVIKKNKHWRHLWYLDIFPWATTTVS